MDYVIVFFDGSELVIEKQMAELIASGAKTATQVRIGESFYKLSSIAKVLSLEDYFKAYPDKRPDERQEQNFEEIQPITQEQHERAMRGVTRGLKQFIDEQEAQGIAALNARTIYDRAIKKDYKNETVQSLSRAAFG